MSAPGAAGWMQKLLQGRTPYLISGGFVAVGAVAIVLLLALAGGGVPSLPNPFGGTGQPDSSEFDEMSAGKTSDPVPSEFDVSDTSPAAVPFATTCEVPVVVRGAPTVGSLHLEMTYDSTAVEVTSVQSGSLPSDSLFEYNATPGRVTIGLVCPEGLSGDWEVAVVQFQALPAGSTGGQRPLAYENVVAHGADSLLEIGTVVSSGSVLLDDMSVMAPAISFS